MTRLRLYKHCGETEFLGVAALCVESPVGDAYRSPHIGSEQLGQTTLSVRVSLVRFVRLVPVALGKPTIDAVPVYTVRQKRFISFTIRSDLMFSCDRLTTSNLTTIMMTGDDELRR